MPTVTLTPDSTTYGPSYNLVGSGTVHGALSDWSDASYTQPFVSDSVTMSNFSQPAGTVVKSMQFAIRGANGYNTFWGQTYGYGEGYFTWSGGSQTFSTTFGGGFSDLYGAVLTGAYSEAQINSIEATVSGDPQAWGTRFSQAWVNVTYANPPGTPTWSAPPSALPPSTLKPVHTWSHVAGTDGGGQTKYRVRVFTLAQATIGGFNPGTSPSTQDTGNVTSGTNSWTPGSNLVPGTTYRSYVATAATTNGIDQWSGWSAAREFRIVSVPTTSVDAVAPDPIPTSNIATIDWTNTFDNYGGGGFQSRYWVRVFSDDQYSIGGFNPETSPATYDSGNVTSSVSVTTTSPLPGRGQVYRAYVRVGQTTNGIVHYSSWAFDQFTTGGTPLSLAAGTRAAVTITGGARAVITDHLGNVL